mmetsp:Transcript_20155/g.9339  ORF Transcript_20155/g.9339 Transcript_20155/m.9339 type:complete len:90 (-) Transcript_20155:37-306(-)
MDELLTTNLLFAYQRGPVMFIISNEGEQAQDQECTLKLPEGTKEEQVMDLLSEWKGDIEKSGHFTVTVRKGLPVILVGVNQFLSKRHIE